MKKFIDNINSKLITAHTRATAALKNDNGMEVIQFLGVALVSIAVASLLYSTLKGSLDTHIAGLATKISSLFA